MRVYDEFAEWWPLFSPAEHYLEEVDDFLRRLAPLPEPQTKTLLELGSGGGSFAFHLKPHFKLTLTDLSEGMLAQNRAINPEAEFFTGLHRRLRLHDARAHWRGARPARSPCRRPVSARGLARCIPPRRADGIERSRRLRTRRLRRALAELIHKWRRGR